VTVIDFLACFLSIVYIIKFKKKITYVILLSCRIPLNPIKHHVAQVDADGQIRLLPSLRLFMTTVTLERAIAPAAMAGWRSLIMPGTQETVWSTPAANGTRVAL
jgi:hypothetical protein